MIRERGSRVQLEHDRGDPNCVEAEIGAMFKDGDNAACCPICGERLAREQAASAINLRELGS